VAVVLTLVQTNINETIQKHSTNTTKHSKYKYIYYQITHVLKTHTYTRPHITKPTLTHPHITKQVTTTTVQVKETVQYIPK